MLNAIGLRRFHRETGLENSLLIELPSAIRWEEFTVTKKGISPHEGDEAIAESTKRELEPPGYAPTDAELAEFFGGGSGFLPIWRPTFGLIRLSEERDE